jgi:hypothetical protein
MTPEQRRELLSLLARADQLVADSDKWMNIAPDAESWVIAEDIREMLVERRARIEGAIDRRAQ